MKTHVWHLCAALCAIVLLANLADAAEQRRDPFKSLIGDPGKADLTLIEPEPSNLLGEYDLKELRVIGIVLGELGDHAILLAPDGKSYMIPVGAVIGKFDGVVTEITENVVRVKETMRYSDGTTITEHDQQTELALNPLADSSPPESRFIMYSDPT